MEESMEMLLFLALLGTAVSIVAGRERHDANQPVTIYLVRPDLDPPPTNGSFGVGLVVGLVLMLILVGASVGS
jgi:hypothetical protein